jgi:uncharacterized membrane protein YeaQ/YmgE (transglycosylase-associated protein family)
MLNILLWLAAGSILAWIAYTHLGLNKGHSLLLSVVIGAAGALLGGIVIAPQFASLAVAPGIFSITDLLFAMAAATVCLALDGLLYSGGR